MPQKVPTPNPTNQALSSNKTSESILVVQRNHLFPEGPFEGLKQVNFQEYANIITTHKQFLPRHLMESDCNYKQIIPYLVFTHQQRYFLMQRHAKASETRLQNKFSLGIGGHIYQQDMLNNDIYSWAKREFHEEVNYTGSLEVTPLGIINDDSNEVGMVHIGFVFLLQGNSPTISIKSELAQGTLLTLNDINLYRDSLESWSTLVYDYLLNR